ncbi:MAG: (Fe-S)-binding protein [Desulfovibrio sp.]|nr:(Fe-S)-binding protein [Desulfovibrio sp.]
MKIGFFVPCYIDAICPEAAISTWKLLKKLGLDVEFIEGAACCGLPEHDMGYIEHSCAIEKGVAPFVADKAYDHVVVPSGICTGQFRMHFECAEQTPEVEHFRKTVCDPVELLHDILKIDELPGKPSFPHRVALHNGCHSLRYLHEARPSELMIKPFDKCADLLALVDGIEVGYAERRDECCGFGGAFSVWDAPCAGQQGRDKVSDYERQGFKYVTSQDMSCLLHQQTVARKNGLALQMFYITEILNGDAAKCAR